MGVLSRFADIISANFNALLDKAEDPAKMVDQYLRNMAEDLADVKKETAEIMAEESRTKRLAEENSRESAKYNELAKKALVSGNEGDARVFLKKKQELESAGAGLQMSAAVAHENAVKMREMHDKLVRDINELNARRQSIKAKATVAKSRERINELTSSAGDSEGAMSAFERMEDRVNRRLDAANAQAELNSQPLDDAIALEEKYKHSDVDESVSSELAALKSQLGIN